MDDGHSDDATNPEGTAAPHAAGSSGISRRGAIGAAVGTAITLAVPAMARPAKRPNFLFMLADDMGFADLSCYGRSDYRTPVLDRLAEQGVRFTTAYANSAVCTATRVALATGRYQYRLPIGLEEPLVQRNVGLPPDHPTVASLLRRQGYATSLIGKWHLGNLPDYDPLRSGYDEFWGLRGGGVDYFTHEVAGRPDLWEGPVPVAKAGYLTDLLADRAIDTLGRYARGGKPWLMSLHFTAPHWPWEAPGDESESRRLAALSGPLALAAFDGGDMKTYAAMVTRLDQQIGRVLGALEALGMNDDTVVVFTSDNGGERFSATWPFSGRKSELLEGGVRVPAIVRWPGVTNPGVTSDAQIMSMDWTPTFVAAAGGGAHPRHPFDGIDIRGAIAGGRLPERSLFWRYKHMEQQSMRRGRLKYLKIAGNSFLFDVVGDPMERANLKERRPEDYKAMVQAWQTWNSAMLPLDPASFTHGFSGKDLADHFGTPD